MNRQNIIVATLSLIVLIGTIIILTSVIPRENFAEGYMKSKYGSDVTAPIDNTPLMKTGSIWDYYGTYKDFLFDELEKGDRPKYLDGRGFYCDRPNRNRFFLVNPLLTQKQIFIKPSVNAFLKRNPWAPDWGNSAQDIRIGSQVEFDPFELAEGEDVIYSDFSKVARDYERGGINPAAYIDNYAYRCGLSEPYPPINTYTNPYW